MVSPDLKVAVVGRNFGKFHAQWYHQLGCQVTAIVGTQEQPTRETAQSLSSQFGYEVKPFWQWARFIKEGNFEAASVCSPPERHFFHTESLLQADKHVFCEKPFLAGHLNGFDAAKKGTHLIGLASRNRLILGMNAQLPAIMPYLKQVYYQITQQELHFDTLNMVLESRERPRSTHYGPMDIWIDLGPHLIAMASSITQGEIDLESLKHDDRQQGTTLDFTWKTTSGKPLQVHFDAGITPEDATPLRLIGNQDLMIAHIGCKTVDGRFHNLLRFAEDNYPIPDPMRISIQRFVEAVQTGDGSKLLINAGQALIQYLELSRVLNSCWPKQKLPFTLK